jgi:hypothetical protein
MRKIFKYRIEPEGDTAVRMPSGSRLLSIGYQGGEAFLWAQVNLRAHEISRTIRAVTTGEELHLNTWQAPLIDVLRLKNSRGEHYVAHVFDMGEKNL